MHSQQPSVIILTGPLRSGKSTLLLALLYYLRRERLTVAGIIAEGLWEKGVRSGFNLLDVAENVIIPLCRRADENGPRAATPYVFSREGMAAGRRALSVERCAAADVVFIDEVGPLEIRGEGWAPSLSPLLDVRDLIHIWVVRESCLDGVKRMWGLEDAEVVDVKETDAVGRLTGLCLRTAQSARQPGYRGKE
ncbi:MAG TPA: nucleoside-triphosphatase [Geobacteraceae bacterium]|nr:nucleoside-triphosphatase [Geobacteraceae bacterium]